MYSFCVSDFSYSTFVRFIAIAYSIVLLKSGWVAFLCMTVYSNLFVHFTVNGHLSSLGPLWIKKSTFSYVSFSHLSCTSISLKPLQPTCDFTSDKSVSLS